MNKLLQILQNRTSHRNLTEPHPTSDEMEEVYKTALRSPDHAWLKPSRFIEVTGEGLTKLSNIFYTFAKDHLDISDPDILNKYKNAPYRAPMIVILITNLKEHPKVPYIEQKLSTAASGQNILNALEILGYSGIWRTGKLAFSSKLADMLGLDSSMEIVGFLYIGSKEAERCVSALYNLILEVDKSKETDSPLFHYIRGVQPYSLPEEEYIQVIKDLAEKEKSIFALTEKAKHEMSQSNFGEAKKYWKKLVDKVDNDSYFIQQLALSTYKDKSVSQQVALTDALGIIKELEPDNRNTIDPETLGISGAIYRRLWENNPEVVEYLNRAIDYYKRGFTINQDYYTGENYAFCLNLKASISQDEEEKVYLNFSAKEIRKEIIEIITQLKEDEDFEIRSDKMWIYATLSNCYYGLNELETHKEYKTKFYKLNPVEWQIETFEDSLKKLSELIK